jgi:hypothetical protein
MWKKFRMLTARQCTVLVSFFVGWIECVAIVTASLVLPPENIGVGCAFFASTRAVTGSIAGKFPQII